MTTELLEAMVLTQASRIEQLTAANRMLEKKVSELEDRAWEEIQRLELLERNTVDLNRSVNDLNIINYADGAKNY